MIIIWGTLLQAHLGIEVVARVDRLEQDAAGRRTERLPVEQAGEHVVEAW